MTGLDAPAPIPAPIPARSMQHLFQAECLVVELAAVIAVGVGTLLLVGLVAEVGPLVEVVVAVRTQLAVVRIEVGIELSVQAAAHLVVVVSAEI